MSNPQVERFGSDYMSRDRKLKMDLKSKAFDLKVLVRMAVGEGVALDLLSERIDTIVENAIKVGELFDE